MEVRMKEIPVTKCECTKSKAVVKKVRKKINVLDFLLVQVFVCLVLSLVLIGIRAFGEPEAAAVAVGEVFSTGTQTI